MKNYEGSVFSTWCEYFLRSESGFVCESWGTRNPRAKLTLKWNLTFIFRILKQGISSLPLLLSRSHSHVLLYYFKNFAMARRRLTERREAVPQSLHKRKLNLECSCISWQQEGLWASKLWTEEKGNTLGLILHTRHFPMKFYDQSNGIKVWRSKFSIFCRICKEVKHDLPICGVRPG